MAYVEFPLTFEEAMEVVFNGGAVQGEHFAWTYYMTAENEVAKLNEFCEDKYPAYCSRGNMLLTKGAMRQKYRVVHVLNRAGLYHF